MLSRSDFMYFADRALDGMAGIVGGLGDELANRTPPLPGANSPYALLTHCLGVVEAWAGGLVAGREVDRDRDAEFTASGPVAPLLARVGTVRAALAADVGAARPDAGLARTPPASFDGPDRPLTQGAALQHVYEELAQHHGQMQVLRDVLLAAAWPAPERLRDGGGAKWRDVEPDVLPAWVADMDLGVAPPVLARITAMLERQDLGYPYAAGPDPVATAFEHRMQQRYGWTPAPGRTRVLSDLLQILQLVIEQTTEPGDGVAIHVPAYPPFLESIRRAGRVIVPIPMVDTGAGWTFDEAALRDRLARQRCRLLVVVNPHNPTGRVFTPAELAVLADCAEEHDLTVLADEIHADLTHAPHRHRPFAAQSPRTAARTVTTTSATKAFNIAGLRCAVAHIGPDALAKRLDAAPLDYFGTPSAPSRAATVAAWTEAGDWHAQTLAVLRSNRDRVAAWAAAAGLRHHTPEATYLAWVDFTGTALAADPAGLILRHGRVRLSPGPDFSAHTDVDGRAYARINFATTPSTLAAILSGLDRALAA